MRICLISVEYPPETGGGGIGTQTYLKATGLARRGHTVHVLTSTRNSAAPAQTYQDGQATIHRIVNPNIPRPGYETATYWIAYASAVSNALCPLHDQVKFDLVHFPEYGGEGFIFQTDTFAHPRPRISVQAHGPLGMLAEQVGWPPMGSTMHQIGCFLERSVIQHCDLLMASSHNTARFCATHYDYPLSRIAVVHSGIDTDAFAPRAPDGEVSRGPRLLFVGKFSEIKGFDLTVDVVLRLLARYPDLRLRMIGKGDQSHIKQVQRRVADAGAAQNIELLGYVPYLELPQHYAWCDMFAGPSVFEPGPGNIYLEAMSCGKPVVACDTAGTPEVVLDGQTGLLVPPRDPAALQAAIVRLIEEPALRQQLGAAGRESVVQNFAIERYLDKVEGHYLRLLQNASPSPSPGTPEHDA